MQQNASDITNLPSENGEADSAPLGRICPPSRGPGKILTAIVTTGILWCSLYALSEDGTMLPGGPGFSLMALTVISLIGGAIVDLARLPGLLGMLLVGVMLRNVPFVDGIGTTLNPHWSSKLRAGALMVILTRGGLGLDPAALKRLSFVVLRLAFGTAFMEAVAVGLAAMFFLSLPWGYAFMLGCIICASSPAVVVPCLLTIQERGLGVKQGIPTLIMAAASIDDVMAITAFSVLFSITFSEGGLAMKIISGPLQAVAGVIWGVLIGVSLWYVPPRDTRARTELRCILLLLAGIVALFGGPIIGMDGFGALGTIVCAFVAAMGWKKDWDRLGHDPVSVFFNDLWFIFQPLLFGLIGAEIDMQRLKIDRVAYGLLTLAIGSICRAITTSVVVLGAGFTAKERLFIILAWFPKATVQAAFASVILDHVQRIGLSEEAVGWGFDILTMSVLVILITAPFGAAAITLTAPRLLRKDEGTDEAGYSKPLETFA